jgi:hypothetical protein
MTSLAISGKQPEPTADGYQRMLSQIIKAFGKTFRRAGPPFCCRSQQAKLHSDRLSGEFIIPANPELGLRDSLKIPFVWGKCISLARVIHSIVKKDRFLVANLLF